MFFSCDSLSSSPIIFGLPSCGQTGKGFPKLVAERTLQAGSTLIGSKVLSCVVCLVGSILTKQKFPVRRSWHRGIPLITGGNGWRIQALMQWAAAYDMPVAIAVAAWSAYVARPKTRLDTHADRSAAQRIS